MRDLSEKNPFLEKASVGKTPMGFFNYSRDTVVLDITETVDFDFVIIDNEYTGMERETMEKPILAAELNQVVPFIRIPKLIPYLMRSYMEMDAHGVLMPHIRGEVECRMAQEVLGYPLYGNASCCRSNHADGFEAKDWIKYLDYIRELVFIPMIGNPEVIGHLNEILDELKPGRDMAIFGKADYGQACGSLSVDGTSISEVSEAYLKVMERCRVRGIGFMACPSAGSAGQTVADVKEVIEEGCFAVVLNTDQLTLAVAFGDTVGPCLALDVKK